MRDQRRILGTLFWSWAGVQLIGAVVATVMPQLRRDLVTTGSPTVFWIVSVLMALAFAWTGARLRQHDPRIRAPAIILSVLALLTFPVGTALGIYGLWVLLRRSKAPGHRANG